MANKTPKMRSYLSALPSFEDGTASPRSFLEDCLASIDELESEVGAFVVRNIEGARLAADLSSTRWKEGEMRSLIDGMPLCIKDIMETADMPTGQGSDLFPGWEGKRDCAAQVRRTRSGAKDFGQAHRRSEGA